MPCPASTDAAHPYAHPPSAGKLLGTVEEAEGKLAGWLPAGRLHQLAARREQLGELLQQLQAGRLRTMGELL